MCEEGCPIPASKIPEMIGSESPKTNLHQESKVILAQNITNKQREHCLITIQKTTFKPKFYQDSQVNSDCTEKFYSIIKDKNILLLKPPHYPRKLRGVQTINQHFQRTSENILRSVPTYISMEATQHIKDRPRINYLVQDVIFLDRH
jgi:hypothetical protein